MPRPELDIDFTDFKYGPVQAHDSDGIGLSEVVDVTVDSSVPTGLAIYHWDLLISAVSDDSERTLKRGRRE